MRGAAERKTMDSLYLDPHLSFDPWLITWPLPTRTRLASLGNQTVGHKRQRRKKDSSPQRIPRQAGNPLGGFLPRNSAPLYPR